MKIENIVQRFSCISFLTDRQYQPYIKKLVYVGLRFILELSRNSFQTLWTIIEMIVNIVFPLSKLVLFQE